MQLTSFPVWKCQCSWFYILKLNVTYPCAFGFPSASPVVAQIKSDQEAAWGLPLPRGKNHIIT